MATTAREESLWPAFIQHTATDLGDLERILAGRNLPALRQWMHRMRGALLVLNCRLMAARCHDVEMRCGLSRRWDEQLAGNAHEIADHLRALVSRLSPRYRAR